LSALEALDPALLSEPTLRERQQRIQQEAVSRAQQAAQNVVDISNYEDCIICGDALDNIHGPGPSDKCHENCDDVVKVCKNDHMFHRGCILQACNAESVDVAAQMGSEYSYLRPQARKARCPLCTEPLQPTCEELVTASKVPDKDLPLKSTGGRKRRTRKRRITNRRRTKKRTTNKKRINKKQTKKRRKN
jgi:hypothetical protein